MTTRFQLLNHASLLITYRDEVLITDPWYNAPAFGSWLPVPPLCIHPVYIASIDNISILVSHGHDDHFDDKFLAMFDKDCLTITSNFHSPGVTKRLEAIGFNNILKASREGTQIGAFLIKSYRNEKISLDDAIYSIRTPDAMIIHCNDCWFAFDEEIKQSILTDVATVGNKKVVLLSQTNSASGYPLNYTNYTEEEKRRLLQKKIKKMVNSGLQNCVDIGIDQFIGYAGYTLPFVKDRPEYITNSIFPSPAYLRNLCDEHFHNRVKILEVLPGKEYHFENATVANAMMPSYKLDAVIEKSRLFYTDYETINECDSYNPIEVSEPEAFKIQVENFLNHFNEFATYKSKKDDIEATIIGKILTIDVEDLEYRASLRFGSGLVDSTHYNKKIIVQSNILNRVIQGNSWFENLYTGYNAEFNRNPENEYNKDITSYMVMFSYYYRNRILKKAQ